MFTNFRTATLAQGLTNPNGTFNPSKYTRLTPSQVSKKETRNTWVDAKGLKQIPQGLNFGSGSDRLLLNNASVIAKNTLFSMGKGNDDIVHDGRFAFAKTVLGAGYDRFVAASASDATINLGAGNDIANIRHLDGKVNLYGGQGLDTYRMAGFKGINSIDDAKGTTIIDFNEVKKNKSNQVVTDDGVVLTQRKDGKYVDPKGAIRTPGKSGTSINQILFNPRFVLGDQQAFELKDTRTSGLIQAFVDKKAPNHSIRFYDGEITRKANGNWVKTVKTKTGSETYTYQNQWVKS
jgi:hypothetical protein